MDTSQKYVSKIYSLSDKAGNIFYIRRTTSELSRRLAFHIYEAVADKKRTPNKPKIDKIRSLDYDVNITVLQIVTEVSTSFKKLPIAQKAESKWIAFYLNKGVELLNIRGPHFKRKGETLDKVGARVSSLSLRIKKVLYKDLKTA